MKVAYSFITSTSPNIRAEGVQDPVLLHTFLNTFGHKFTSLKHSLLVLQVKTNIVWD